MALVCMCLALSIVGQGLRQPPAGATTVSASVTASECTEGPGASSVEPHQGCIAGTLLQTRQRITDPNCFKPSQAVGSTFGIYLERGCKQGANKQIESIAQARMIAQLDAREIYSPSTNTDANPQITPDIQWEVSLPTLAGTGVQYPDILIYDRENPGPIDVIENKVRGGATIINIGRQAQRYADALERHNKEGRDARLWTGDYVDTFGVFKPCGNGRLTASVTMYGSLRVADGVVLTSPLASAPIPVPCDFDFAAATLAALLALATEKVASEIKKFLDDHTPDWNPGGGFNPPPPLPPLPPTPPNYWPPDGVVAAGVIATVIAVGVVVCLAVPACSIPAAASAVGVTAAALIAALFLSAAPAAAAGVSGDPHLRTLDGLSYDIQSAGEFHLLTVPEYEIDVQARFEPWGSGTSVMRAIAVELGENRVEIRGADLYVDGAARALPEDGLLEFADGAIVAKHNGQYAIVPGGGPDGRMVAFVNGTSASFFVPDGVGAEGLLGDHDGDPMNDLQLEDGTVLSAISPTAKIHGPFADAWRITDAESSFTYASGQGTATFTDRTFPTNVISIGDFTDDEIEAASTTCRVKGVAGGPTFEDCVYDVLVTGDEAYATAAAAITGEVVDPFAASFGADGVLTEDFTAPVATNFAATRYLTDAVTSRVAGPFFDAAPYRFYALDVPRHEVATLSMDLVAYGPVDGDQQEQAVDISIDDAAPVHAVLEGNAPVLSGPATPGGSITRLSSGVTAADGRAYSVYRVVLPITHYGTALRVALAPQHFKSLLNTSMGVNKVSIALAAPGASGFDTSLPLVLSPGSLGVGSGRLESGGAEDDYVFDVLPGSGYTDRLQVVRSCSEKSRIFLRNLDTGARVPVAQASCDSVLFRNVDPARYALEVMGDGTATDTSLTAYRVPAPQDAGSYVLDAGTRTITTPLRGEDAVLTFQGSRGQRIQMQTTDASYTEGGMRWQVVAPDGSNSLPWPQSMSGHGANEFQDVWVLPADGTYTVTVDPQGTATGSVKFRAWTMPADLGGLTLDNPAVTGSLQQGQKGVWTLAGQAGQRIALETSGSTFGFVGWKLVDPTSVVLSAGSGNGWTDAVTLPSTGTYRLVVEPSSAQSGSIDVRGWTIGADVDAGVVALNGTQVSATVDIPGRAAEARFVASGGQRVSLRLSGSTYSGVGWKVLDPSGAVATSGSGDAFVEPFVAVAGTYRVVVDPTARATGTLVLQGWSVSVDVAAGSLASGTAKTVAVATPGQNGRLTLTGTVGQRIALQSASSTYTGMTWVLLDPTGTVVATGRDNAFQDVLTLAKAGTYTVLVDPTGPSTGSVSMTAWTVPTDVNGGALTLGTAKTVTISNVAQDAYVSISGTANQRLAMETTASTFANVDWKLLTPTGTQVAAGSGNTFQDVVVLPAAGTYKFVINPRGTATGRLSVKAWTVPADVNAGAVTKGGAAVKLTVSTAGQNGYFTFAGTIGQKVTFATIAGTLTNVSWRLLRPDGSTLLTGSGTPTNTGVLTLPSTGTFRFVVDPAGAGTGTISLKAT